MKFILLWPLANLMSWSSWMCWLSKLAFPPLKWISFKPQCIGPFLTAEGVNNIHGFQGMNWQSYFPSGRVLDNVMLPLYTERVFQRNAASKDMAKLLLCTWFLFPQFEAVSIDYFLKCKLINLFVETMLDKLNSVMY